MITGFLFGCGEVFFDTSAEAMLPNVVDDDLLARANSRLYVTQSIAVDLIGPPIGALLFAVAASLPFLLDSWSFLASAMIVLTLRGSFRPKQQHVDADADAGAAQEPPASARKAIADGWHFARGQRLLRSLIVLGCAWNFFAIGSESTTVLFAKRELHMSDAAFGLTWAGFAIGGVIAGWLTERIVDRFGPGHTILATFLLGGIAGTTAALSHNAVVFAVGFAASFAAGTAASIVVVTLRQQLVPDALRGRVLGDVSSGDLLFGRSRRARDGIARAVGRPARPTMGARRCGLRAVRGRVGRSEQPYDRCRARTGVFSVVETAEVGAVVRRAAERVGGEQLVVRPRPEPSL